MNLSSYFNTANIAYGNGDNMEVDEILVPTMESVYLCRVDSIDLTSFKVNETRWCRKIPHDKPLEYDLKQCAYLLPYPYSAGNQRKVKLVFWDSQCMMTTLFAKGDLIMLRGLMYNELASTDTHIVMEFTPNATLCVVPGKSTSIQLPTSNNTTKPNNDITGYFYSIPSSPSLTTNRMDMALYANRLYISELVTGMINVTLIARIIHIGRNKSSQVGMMTLNKTPLLVSDGTATYTLLLLDAISMARVDYVLVVTENQSFSH
eukprot:gene422-499_t